MSCKCLLRAYCFDGAVLASKAAKAFREYVQADSFETRGRWLLAKRNLDLHVARARARWNLVREARKRVQLSGKWERSAKGRTA